MAKVSIYDMNFTDLSDYRKTVSRYAEEKLRAGEELIAASVLDGLRAIDERLNFLNHLITEDINGR